MRTLFFTMGLLTAWSCVRDQRLMVDEKIEMHYDSLAHELFLGPEIGLKVTSNVDSFKIEFFDRSDFQLIIDLRNSWQAISDSVGIRFKIENYNVRETELWFNDDIIQYDTLLFRIVNEYLGQRKKNTIDSLKRVIGISPSTILDFHSKAERYSKILNGDKSFSESRKHLIITYYVSEMTDVPYPKTLYRLFVNAENQVVDFGRHEDYDNDTDDEDSGVETKKKYQSS